MINQFARTLTFKTTSRDDGTIQEAEFDKLQSYLKQTYPNFFRQ